MTEGRLQWHAAFGAALRIELGQEAEKLRIEEEHLLGKKPMQMDVLVIKKRKHDVIQKNIARIFRTYNIIEYKSPEDYLSINDFYKVYGYACFYQSETERIGEIDPGELTLTFVCNHYPHKLLRHLRRARGIKAVETDSGIYALSGDPIPMQVIVTKRLSRRENYWLQSLRCDLQAGSEIQDILKAYEPKKHDLWYQALMEVIVRANWEKMEEERDMCNALRELFAEEFRISEERGEQRGEKRGEERGILCGREQKAHEVAVNLHGMGFSMENIAKVVGMQIELVQQWLPASAQTV